MTYLFKQKRFFVKRNFEVTENSLIVSVEKLYQYYEEEFKFEEITKKTVKASVFNRITIVLGFLCLIRIAFSVAEDIDHPINLSADEFTTYLLFLSILTFFFLITATSTINIVTDNGKQITLYVGLPNRKDVRDFLNLLWSEQKTYLLKRYAKREPYMPLEQLMQQLFWLRGRDIIDDEEFEKLKSDLFPDQISTIPIGFTFNPNDN